MHGDPELGYYELVMVQDIFVQCASMFCCI